MRDFAVQEVPATQRPEPHLITPLDEYEAISGKPTLLTDYHLDELIAALKRTSYDPELMRKLVDLRAATR